MSTKMHGEYPGELRVRFGSVKGGIRSLIGRLLSMISRYRAAWFDGLLIRRSCVRVAPGSYYVNPAFLPCSGPLALGKFTGNSPRDRVPVHLQFAAYGWFA